MGMLRQIALLAAGADPRGHDTPTVLGVVP